MALVIESPKEVEYPSVLKAWWANPPKALTWSARRRQVYLSAHNTYQSPAYVVNYLAPQLRSIGRVGK